MAKVRKLKQITPMDERRILDGLELLAEDRTMPNMRLRTFVHILWDGAIRSKTVLGLNMEEVVVDPLAARIRVVEEVTMRADECNRFRKLKFLLGQRSRKSIQEYLQVVRRDRWLGSPKKGFVGPLFISSQAKGSGARMAIRSPSNIWRTFLQTYIDDRMDYGLDDIVYTGRLAYLQAAGGNIELLAEHANVDPTTAARYQSDLATMTSPSARDALAMAQKPRPKR